MKVRLISLAFCAALGGPAAATPTYLGLYMQGQKIGYASYASVKSIYQGHAVDRSDSRTVMDTGLLGTPMHIQIDSTTLTGDNSKPLLMTFSTTSEGRTQKVSATFKPKTVEVDVDNSGNASHRSLANPSGSVVDDPISLVIQGKKDGKCFVLDPSTVSFVENQFHVVSHKKVVSHGKPIDETIVDIVDPRATTRVYVSAAGDILKAEGPMGITMLPVTERVALAKPSKYSPKVDLAYSNSIVPIGKLEDPGQTSELKLQFTGRNVRSIPSDESQAVSSSGDSWTVDIHPPRIGESELIQTAAQQKKEWVKEDLNMPSDKQEFTDLAKKIVGDQKRVIPAAMAIKKWVYDEMKPNAGIGVLRDASEVLKTKEGVCRDYAVLTGTLLRSAGIPTRLASGLVNWDGTFYYHAWDEVWDGKHWIGIDSTTPDQQISAAHLKLAQGTVASAFTFAVLDGVKIRILASHGQ